MTVAELTALAERVARGEVVWLDVALTELERAFVHAKADAIMALTRSQAGGRGPRAGGRRE